MTSGAIASSEIITTDPRVDPRWQVLASERLGHLFISPPWLRAVCDTYGFEPTARIALDSAGRPTGGVAWVPIDDIRGRRLTSVPFSDRADPPVDDPAVWTALYREITTGAGPFTLRCFEDALPARGGFEGAAQGCGLERVGTAAWHGTPLDAPVEELHRRLSKHARRNIAIAERDGVRVEANTGLEAVYRFHGLHVGLRKRKYRLLAQPAELFERLWHEFSADDAIVTLLAYAGDELLGGALFLVWNGQLYYKFGASRHEHLALRPNDAIFWAGIQWGAQRGLGLLDWGLSDLDQPGLVAYKRKWATEERKIVTLRSGGDDAATPAEVGAMLGQLTELFTDDSVPDEITARAGALLYRYFC